MLRLSHFISNRDEPPRSGAYLDDIDPATGELFSEVPDGDERDVDMAVEAAARAFPGWSGTSAAERSRLLLRLADLIEERLDEFVLNESMDNGKPVALARGLDIPRAAANLRFFATAILHWSSASHATDAAVAGGGRAINYTLHTPRGVAGCISPWNLPLYLFTWKIAPALATGNTVVAKPSELTPVTAYLLGLAARDAGLPPGVLNIVHGLGAKVGAAIVAHPRVPAISFTGGTRTGREIARVAGPMFKKLSLELGGKNPTIVFADADLKQAVPGCVRASFANQGEVCLCGERLLVQRSVLDAFLPRFVERTRALRVGDPLEPTTDQGAIVSKAHLDKIRSYLALAREEGGEILCGGEAPDRLPPRCEHGAFLEPTVITGLAPDCRVNQEEIFGPVVSVIPFDDEDEAIAIANGTPYGLSASVWTSDLTRAHRVAARLEAGTVWINTWLLRDLRVPFGGVKASGVGREGGEDALRFFTESKNVCVGLG
ncbi:MAG: aldehyde dehydrogenase [Phycisphaerales bacterium]|nr:aldehyde dehydrogenase [Phycisphaerales bacterium]